MCRFCSCVNYNIFRSKLIFILVRFIYIYAESELQWGKSVESEAKVGSWCRGNDGSNGRRKSGAKEYRFPLLLCYIYFLFFLLIVPMFFVPLESKS